MLSNHPNVLGGSGDTSLSGAPIVGGPSSSTDNALVRWDGTTGQLVQDGVVTEADYAGTLTGATDQATTSAAGSAFANQPSNDSITLVSNSASDVQTATVIGTTTATNTVVTEAVVLTGTTPAVTVKANWGQILAIKLSSAAVGTLTIKKTTGATTITTIAAAATSKGVNTVTNTAAFNRAISTVANGSTTKQIGWGGTNTAGTQIYDSKALNGATAVASNSSFYTLTEIYSGDLEATRTVTVTTNGSWSLTGGGGGVLSFSTLGAGATVSGTFGSAGFSRVTADVTNATATMANLTDLSVTVASGVKYTGTIQIFGVDSTNVDGLSFDLGGGAASFTDLEFGFAAQPTGATLGVVTSTTSTTAITLTVVSTSDAVYTISFGFTCNAGGTFIPRFSQTSHSTGTATVRKNSSLTLVASAN